MGSQSLWAQVAISAVCSPTWAQRCSRTQRGTSTTIALSDTLEGSSAPELAQAWGQTGNGMGDRGPWAPAVPAAGASSPALPFFPPPPADVLRCLNQIPSPATPPLMLLIPGRRGRQEVESFSCWLLPAPHFPNLPFSYDLP